MPAYSEQKQQEHMERVREVLAIYPRAGVHKISELLAADPRSPIKLDPNYILNKLKKKIEGERSRRFDSAKVEKYISKLEDEVEQVVVRAWSFLLNPQFDERVRVAAAKIIIDAKFKLLDAKLNSGIFEKHLGTLRINTSLTEERKIMILHTFKNWGIIKGELPAIKENGNKNTGAK